MSDENIVQNNIRLAASYAGVMLFRNNNGAFTHPKTGQLVRYGLGNDSKKTNQEMKSSDLIGFTPMQITQDMVGKTIAVFTSVEVKPSDWHGSARTDHEKAQKKWNDFIIKNGGFAGFAQSVEDFYNIFKR